MGNDTKPKSPAALAFPIEWRPDCLGCHKRMKIVGSAGKYPCWHCGRCKVYAMTHATCATKVFSDRPCCVTCRSPAQTRTINRTPRWICKRCGWSRNVRISAAPAQAGPPPKAQPAAPDPNAPHCIKHRQAMHLSAEQWTCSECRRIENRRANLRHQAEYPLESRPYCVKCRESMNVLRHLKTPQPDRWQCHRCEVSCSVNAVRDSSRDLYPCCLACRQQCSKAGTVQRQRWKCEHCNVSFPADRPCVWQARVERVRDLKPVSSEYRKGLRHLRLLVHRLMRSDSGHPFNSQLYRFRAQLVFYLDRSPEKDRAAVIAEIDAGCSTPEEIADALPLTVDEIKLICDEIVKSSTKRTGYEWRPIGAYTEQARGTRAMGIFPVDAPTLIKPITQSRNDLDFYNVDRAGLAEVASMVRRAARG